MARETALTRWPKIVQSMLDDVTETLQLGESESLKACQINEGRHIQRELRILKEDIIQDQPLRCVVILFFSFSFSFSWRL